MYLLGGLHVAVGISPYGELPVCVRN
jgi:hypothetical protein